MPAAGRLGDQSQVPKDAHGCPACPHGAAGPAVTGSGDVNINGRPALRVGDHGIHAACCGPNTWEASAGARAVFINGQPAHRLGDATQHCGGSGKLIEGSDNVFIGDWSGPERFEGGFILLDHDGKPMVDCPYVIRRASGEEHEGRTDEQGRTQMVVTDAAEELTVQMMPEDPCGS